MTPALIAHFYRGLAWDNAVFAAMRETHLAELRSFGLSPQDNATIAPETL